MKFIGGGGPFHKFLSSQKEGENQNALEHDKTLEKVTEVMNQKRKGYSIIKPAPAKEEFDQAAYQAAYQATHDSATNEQAEDVAQATEPIEQAPKVASKSVIASDVVITGNIESKGDLEILGTHFGNVKAEGVVRVLGVVNGDIEAKELVLQGCSVEADKLTVQGNVVVEGSAQVNGDISCESIDIDASVTGNIRATQKCTIHGTAIMNGDITAGAISIEEGAKLHSSIDIVI